MNKKEISKLEKTCWEGIYSIEDSIKLERKYNETKQESDLLASIAKFNYAEGINQVLVSINYKSDSMKKLNELIGRC